MHSCTLGLSPAAACVCVLLQIVTSTFHLCLSGSSIFVIASKLNLAGIREKSFMESPNKERKPKKHRFRILAARPDTPWNYLSIKAEEDHPKLTDYLISWKCSVGGDMSAMIRFHPWSWEGPGCPIVLISIDSYCLLMEKSCWGTCEILFGNVPWFFDKQKIRRFRRHEPSPTTFCPVLFPAVYSRKRKQLIDLDP